MASEDKSLQLRVIDDHHLEPTPVIRLDNSETEQLRVPTIAIRVDNYETEQRRLRELEAAEESQRLEAADGDKIELRTHQPGIDVLIDAETLSLEHLEQDWESTAARRHILPWGWFAVIALMIAGAVVWSLTHVEKADFEAERIREETASAIVEEERKDREAGELVDRINTAIVEFIGVKSVESLIDLVRQSERVAPLMRQYYGDKPVDHGAFKSIKSLRPVTIDNRGNFWMATVELSNGKVQSLVLEIGGNGEPEIDWETFVCHQSMPWDDFARQRPNGVSLDFRVYLERDNFYNYEFANAEHWVCYRLTALESEETVFGYAEADSDVARELQQQSERYGNGRLSLILRLTIPNGLQSRNGVVIEKLICPRWLYLDPPDPGS